MVKSKSGDLSGALVDYNHAIERDPHGARAFIGRGLVKQRIVSEHEDQGARIKELEELVTMLEYELACARGVSCEAALGELHSRQGLADPGSISVDLSCARPSAGSSSIDHGSGGVSSSLGIGRC